MSFFFVSPIMCHCRSGVIGKSRSGVTGKSRVPKIATGLAPTLLLADRRFQRASSLRLTMAWWQRLRRSPSCSTRRTRLKYSVDALCSNDTPTHSTRSASCRSSSRVSNMSVGVTASSAKIQAYATVCHNVHWPKCRSVSKT